jgi:hypothetical protein
MLPAWTNRTKKAGNMSALPLQRAAREVKFAVFGGVDD